MTNEEVIVAIRERMPELDNVSDSQFVSFIKTAQDFYDLDTVGVAYLAVHCMVDRDVLTSLEGVITYNDSPRLQNKRLVKSERLEGVSVTNEINDETLLSTAYGRMFLSYMKSRVGVFFLTDVG